MTTYAITTAVNIDTLAAKGGSDTYNINGGYLTVDQDSRYGTNNNTSAGMGNITLSATLGGTIEFNSTLVRLIPFDTGASTVPASNTTISIGGASGLLIGVYSALNVAPTAAGAAMPASGYIKIKQWNSVAFTAGALTGISASATGADIAGWIEIVGVDALTVTVNRLNTFLVRGDWYAIGTTDGSRATTYQIPSNGSSAVYLPGVWVETSASSGVYEFYPCAGSQTALLASIATDAVRGKVCWISTAGLLRFGHDGTNSTGGYIPASGLRIRIPNIFFVCCTAATPTANVLPNATLATRMEFATTGAGVIDIDKACINWYCNFVQPFSVALTNTAILTALVVQEIASPIVWSNIGVGHEAANAQFALNMTLCFAGGTIDTCVFARATLASASTYIVSMADIKEFTFTNVKLFSLAARGNATTGAATITRMASCVWSNTTVGCGRVFLTTCADCSFTTTTYFDVPASTTATTNPMYAFDLVTACTNITIDGLTFGGLTLVQPYNGVLNVGLAGCSNIKLRNIGSYASPLDMGDTRRDDLVWSRITTTAAVTGSAHGLKVNDIVYAIVSSNVAAVTVGAKTVASVPSPDIFTFAALNAGSLSGTLSYYPTMASTLVALVAGAAADGIEVKRCYTPRLRTNVYTADNSSKNVLFENVMGNYTNAPVFNALNEELKGAFATPSLTAQTSVYGTHWFDCFTGEVYSGSAVPWTRVTTTATVTSSLHGLRTGETVIVSSASSGDTTITRGAKAITVVTASQFTFTCLNAGSTSGTLDVTNATGRVGLMMNESTSDTSDQYTLSGSSAFTSAGGLYMPSVGQQAIFTSPNYFLGHTGFALAEPIMAGGTLTNYNIYYALDRNDGNGFGSGSVSGTFYNMSLPKTGGGGASGASIVTMDVTDGVAPDDYVFGTNVSPGARVVSVLNTRSASIDRPNIGAVSGILRFCHLPNETNINPALGFRKKISLFTSASNATAITSLYSLTLSTTGSRVYQYPLDLVPLTITNLKNPSEVRVFAYNTTSSVAGEESVTSGIFTASIDVALYPTVDISVLSLGYQNTRFLSQSLGSGLTLQAAQVIDRQYNNP
jgi:hypothetical protein